MFSLAQATPAIPAVVPEFTPYISVLITALGVIVLVVVGGFFAFKIIKIGLNWVRHLDPDYVSPEQQAEYDLEAEYQSDREPYTLQQRLADHKSYRMNQVMNRVFDTSDGLGLEPDDIYAMQNTLSYEEIIAQDFQNYDQFRAYVEQKSQYMSHL